MAERRLIDANALREYWLENSENEYVYDTNSFLSSIDDAPTVDPKSLPIVRQLREELAEATAEREALKMNPPVEIQANTFELAVELAKVSAERDAAVKDLNTIRDCSTCALQYTDKCLLEDCMDPCCSFGSGDVPYKWRGPQKEACP